MDGILNIDKPAGITSYGAVSRIKRLTGEWRVGHAGTLDPMATGVLPVCLGKATRVVEYLSDAAKTYRAIIGLGASTNTYDAAGEITARGDASGIDLTGIEAALTAFRGKISQTPPMFSALKYGGQSLYKLARAGVTVERKPRSVTIYRLEITEWQTPDVTLEIECSKGTYIRSLAHDLGQALGCGAFLKALVRTAYGPFGIDSAISLVKLEEVIRNGQLESCIYPMDCVLQDFPSVTIDTAAAKEMKDGKLLKLEKTSEGNFCRAYAADGRFLGLIRFIPESGLWKPEKVFI